MKRYKLPALFRMCLVAISCFLFATACEKADDVNTNQLASGDVTLESFGPCPIPRGAELRIIGTNLDRVEAIILPGTGSVNDIKRISNNEIRIIVPQTAEEGPIKLKTGSNEISSITNLTFEETILISKISPLSVKAGDVIKVEGDYLNLIAEIIFAEDVHVPAENFKSQSREAIEVAVPVETQTGKIIVSDGADIIPDASGEFGIPIWVYSEDELTVTLPSVTSFSPETIRAGSILTITGKDFDLVESIQFGGDKAAESFTVNEDKTSITVTVPMDAQDGTVVLTAFSGVEVAGGKPLIMVVPTISAIAPNPVKNGAVLTVTGKDLDLISQVMFGGEKEGTIAEGGTATEIKVNIPEDAVSGAVTFTTLAGKTVTSAVLNFVLPVITDINPTTILAGASITITGSNLDLVKKIIFGGNTEGIIASQTETSIEVQSLSNSLSDIIVLVTSNGTEVKSTQEITINSDLPIISSMPGQVKPGAKMTIEGTKLNLVESITFEDNAKAIKYGIRSETIIEVYVPDHAKKGRVTLTLNTFDGKTVISSEFKVVGTDPIVDPSLVIDDFENHNGHDATWDNWGGNIDYNTDEENNHYIQLHSGISGWAWLYGCNHQSSRGNFPSIANPDDYVLKLDLRVTGNYESGVMFAFSFGGWSGTTSLLSAQDNYTTNGEWMTVTIPMSSIWTAGAINGASGDWGMSLNGGTIPVGVEISIDNVRFEQQ